MENEMLAVDQQDCASALKVLADETRLAVVEQLLSGPMHVGEINQSLLIEQSLLSHHLRVLREAGIVTSRRDGKQVLYSLPSHVAAGKGKKLGRAINLGCCQLSFK